MTTDITELAQRVKTEASTIDDTQWYLAKPSEIRSLVEALESKERIIQVLESSYNEQTEALEKAQETIAFQQGEIKALLSSLESRTVKLPDLRQIVSGDRYVWSDGVYNYSQDVKVALAAAGINVEAE